MTTLSFQSIILPSANFNGLSTLPPISEHISIGELSKNFCLDEDDELFLHYGKTECAYPYRYQNCYDRELNPKSYKTAILENDYLKAVFLPEFGGKLHSLIDKKTNKELLFRNDVIRPCNLGVRNAWLSGGIEWNACFKGHGPFTCSLINTAETKLEDGTPVLRFYYFERIRCAVVQMDFFLPEYSHFLYARMRVTNPNDEVIPMYWWSNAAITEKKGNRVIAPADESYTAPFGEVVKIRIPVHNGIDVSYPHNNIMSNDYFWKTHPEKRRYICQLDENGYGILQTSTNRLKGRKLFVWGNTQGGSKWMNFLTADDKSGSYNEIQCGLAHTQYECLPMPPHTVWEWLEAYGAMQANPAAIHGEWTEAQKEAENILETLLPEEKLNKLLQDTRPMAKSRAINEVYTVDSWGALEEYRREKNGIRPMCTHLCFGKPNAEQTVWLSLLERGTVGNHDPKEIPSSYQRQKEWLALLEDAVMNKDKHNWYAYFLLGTAAIAEEHFKDAKQYLEKSLSLCVSLWAEYSLAIAYQKTGEPTKAEGHILNAYSLRQGDPSLAKETFRCLFENEKNDIIVALYEKETSKIRQNARCRLYYAYALAKTGRLQDAENILCENGHYLVVPDIREGELTVTELWYYIQEKKYGKTASEADPPKDLDFRMTAMRNDWF